MTFTILAILEVASLVVLAVSLYGSVRSVYEWDKLRKQTPLTLLSRYRVLYRRVAAVWGRHALGALGLVVAWRGVFALVDGGESSPWRAAYVLVLAAISVICVAMTVTASCYYVRGRHYNVTFDENTREIFDSAILGETSGRDSLASENARARERVYAAVNAAGGEWERELSDALNRQETKRR